MKTYISVKIKDCDREKNGNPDRIVAEALHRAGIKAIVHQQQRLPIYINVPEEDENR